MSAPSSDGAGIRQVIRALRAEGYVITGVHDGDDHVAGITAETPEHILVANLTACDDSALYVRTPEGRDSHVYFVLGNDPEEVVCDYGVSLEPVIGPLTEGWWSE